MRSATIIGSCTAAALLLSLPALAVTIHVPGDVPTIQGAIYSALPGDEIVVAPGTYLERLTFPDGPGGITVRSELGAEVTIIDAETEGRVIRFGYTNFAVTLQGFTITHGQVFDFGGGIAAFGSNVILRENIIRENQQQAYGGAGGGVYFDGSCSPQCLVEGNLIVDNIGSNGAGIYTFAPITIRRNTIVDNRSFHILSTGGGIRSWGATIERNIVVGNQADDGGGVFCGSPSQMGCNDIWGNGDDDVAGSCTLGPSDFSLDPEFCDPLRGDYTLDSGSPCLPQNSPPGCELVGAYPQGCGPVAVDQTTWGGIKSIYR